jgi:glyoxylase-like metal-dependent hydrolase (beta-lactamase superfamily II)
MSLMQLDIRAVVSPMFDENAYVVGSNDAGECFIVDPSFNTLEIVSILEDTGWRPLAILNTHGHLDHIVGNDDLKRRFPDVPIVIGRNDAALLTDPELNLSASYGFPMTSPPADRLLDDGETLSLLGLDWHVREIPGHSPGHVAFICQIVAPAVVFGGDVLFQGSIGRTDFPGGSLETLLAGIHKHLYTLPDLTIVFPGHGASTTIGEEKRTNPFTLQ